MDYNRNNLPSTQREKYDKEMMSLISSQKPAWGNIEAITYYMS